MSKELAKQFDIIKKSIPKRSSQRKGEYQKDMNYEQMKNIMLSTYLKDKFSEILEYSSYIIRIGLEEYEEYYDETSGKFIGNYDKNGWPKSGKIWSSIYRVAWEGMRTIKHFDCISDQAYTINKSEKYYKNFIDPYKNSKKRFHFFDIDVILPINKKLSFKKFSRHSISALYDSKTKYIEFFDTGKKTHSFEVKFNSFFKSIFDDIYGKGKYKMNYSKEYFCLAQEYLDCDYYGDYDIYLKDFIVDGSCSIFTLWFLELRLSNPDLTRKHISDFIIDKTTKHINIYGDKEEYLCDIIRRYGLFVHNYTKDYTIENINGNFVVKRKGKILKSGKYLKIFLGFLSSVAIYSILKKKFKK